MSPHKQAWQHSGSPQGTKFPRGRCRGYGSASPGHSPCGAAPARAPPCPQPPPQPSRSPPHSPLKHSSRSLLRATVGSPSTSWKSAILKGPKRASSRLVQATRDPPNPQSPQFSRAPAPRSAAPTGWGGNRPPCPHRPQYRPALVQARHGGPGAPSPRAA